MSTLFIDLETYNTVPIKFGVHKYAETAEITLISWAIDDSPVHVLDRTASADMPPELHAAITDPSVRIVAHNSGFDRTVLDRLHETDVSRWHDTMVQAYQHSLPGSLGELCEVFGLPTDKAKDKEGRQLVLLFCKPRPDGSRATRKTHPEKWAAFIEYARLDVIAMRELYQRMPRWNCDKERALWLLDQTINDRGVCIDIHLVDGAIHAVNSAKAQLAARTQELTSEEVQAATQRDAMLKHLLSEYGVTLPDLQASTLERQVNNPELPEPLRELLMIRLQASSSSTAKYTALANACSSDARLRGTLQFCGASRTGRWAGRVFQPQNLPRPTLDNASVEIGIAAMKIGGADLLFSNVMELASSSLRGCLIAPKGKKLVVADLSNIEGRVLAWVAGETWKINAFERFDAGKGADLYKLAYAKSFGIKPDDVSKDQRQIGKVQELALGYAGGVGAFLTFARAYGIDLDQMAEQAWPVIPQSAKLAAVDTLEWTRKQKRDTFGLSDKAWLTCEVFKASWRTAHPHVKQLWADVQDAFRRVADGETRVLVSVNGGPKLVFDKVKSWVRVMLPSGRYLCYPQARIESDGRLTYLGINQYSRKWSRLTTYSGKLTENIVQAIARDVLAASMPNIENANYQIVLTVHDEIICETSDTPEYNADHLSQMMSDAPAWAKGLPLAAAGFETYRYRKD